MLVAGPDIGSSDAVSAPSGKTRLSSAGTADLPNCLPEPSFDAARAEEDLDLGPECRRVRHLDVRAECHQNVLAAAPLEPHVDGRVAWMSSEHPLQIFN